MPSGEIDRRRRVTAVWRPNIHDCARSGDLVDFQERLIANPSIINARIELISQTPLHVAAGCNNTSNVKFLLDWNGKERVDLEAKNRLGKTALHLAAEYGCKESTKLLLDYGASLEAKTINGMTPLHLAVWTARYSGNCVTVGTLLDYNADCSIKDDNGMTPLDYLSEGPETSKMRELLSWHGQEQRKRKACSEAKTKLAEFEASLSDIVGLNELKMQLQMWAKGMFLDEKRRALGLNVAPRRTPHMAFLGNPGTGKSMVAQILGKLLHSVGVLPTDKVTEVRRTDLVGEFLGHTGPKMRQKIKEAEGGVLLVDEAYRLIPMQKSDDKDYGLEALEEIMSVMDSGKVVVIFSGYYEPMKRMIASNEGFCRRVTKLLFFDNFSTTELAQILHLKVSSKNQDSVLFGFKLEPSCNVEAIAKLIERETTEKQRKEMNGGLIDLLLADARDNLDLRLDFDNADTDSLITITMEDLEAAIRLLSQEEFPAP